MKVLIVSAKCKNLEGKVDVCESRLRNLASNGWRKYNETLTDSRSTVLLATVSPNSVLRPLVHILCTFHPERVLHELYGQRLACSDVCGDGSAVAESSRQRTIQNGGAYRGDQRHRDWRLSASVCCLYAGS